MAELAIDNVRKTYGALNVLHGVSVDIQDGELYCPLDHYDDDFIVYPCEIWRVDVPANEFRLDRPR